MPKVTLDRLASGEKHKPYAHRYPSGCQIVGTPDFPEGDRPVMNIVPNLPNDAKSLIDTLKAHFKTLPKTILSQVIKSLKV